MRFVATVRPTIRVQFDADVPELAAPERNEAGEAVGLDAWEKQQARVLAARAKAARQAEKAAKAALSGLDAADVVVVEVEEAS